MTTALSYGAHVGVAQSSLLVLHLLEEYFVFLLVVDYFLLFSELFLEYFLAVFFLFLHLLGLKDLHQLIDYNSLQEFLYIQHLNKYLFLLHNHFLEYMIDPFLEGLVLQVYFHRNHLYILDLGSILLLQYRIFYLYNSHRNRIHFPYTLLPMYKVFYTFLLVKFLLPHRLQVLLLLNRILHDKNYFPHTIESHMQKYLDNQIIDLHHYRYHLYIFLVSPHSSTYLYRFHHHHNQKILLYRHREILLKLDFLHKILDHKELFVFVFLLLFDKNRLYKGKAVVSHHKYRLYLHKENIAVVHCTQTRLHQHRVQNTLHFAYL